MDAGLLQQELRPLLLVLRGRASPGQLLLMRPAGKSLAPMLSDVIPRLGVWQSMRSALTVHLLPDI